MKTTLARIRTCLWKIAPPLLGLLIASALSGAARAETEWRIGLAAVRITPEGPIPMCGYSPVVSEGVLDDLYAKAMAIEDGNGFCAVLVTADLLFFRAPLAEVLSKEIAAKTGLERHQILLNASHTHAGPVFGIEDPKRFDLPPDERRRVEVYTERLRGQLVELVVRALADRKPGRLSWGVGKADFVMNRRLITPEGKYRGMGPNPAGPVDRDVPVLRVDGPDGQLRAVVFGCACHPVTLDGANRKISGDYAGFAQQHIEGRHPGSQAMFVIGCGGDANSHPRGGAEQEAWVRKHGESLGAEVCRVLAGELQAVNGPFRALLAPVDLPLAHTFSREQLEEMAAAGQTYWHKRNARGMLEMLDRGEPLPTVYSSSVALWRFGDDLTVVGLPGEAVAAYVPMIQGALGSKRLWVAAYVNESFGYLPTAQILKEGGHETIGLTLAIGLFSPEVQDVVIAAVRQLAEK
ncbi:MAG: neutral/alkaline non-lysosomal ceramidase N-terminal domain-containing protein [Planctomycetota bacterium]